MNDYGIQCGINIQIVLAAGGKKDCMLFRYYLGNVLRKKNCVNILTGTNFQRIIQSIGMKRYMTDWGSFYHGAGGEFAEVFFKDVTEELKIVIGNTKWQGDESWWI